MDCYMDYCSHICADCGSKLTDYTDVCKACDGLLCGNCGYGGNGHGLLCKECNTDEERRERMINRKWIPPMIPVFVLAVLQLVSCSPAPPQEPPPPDPIPPSPPPIGCLMEGCNTLRECREKDDYIPVDRAAYWRDVIQVYDNSLWNNGVLNVGYALTYCPPGSPTSVWPYNGVHAPEARKAREEAWVVKMALAGDVLSPANKASFYGRLGIPHSKYGPGRSMVFRPCFNEWLDRARNLQEGCKAIGQDGKCEKFWPASDAHGVVHKLDGLKGACSTKVQSPPSAVPN